MTQRTLLVSALASALSLSVGSIGRYAREGKIPFDQTPGGHRRFDLDEVRLALELAGDEAVRQTFGVPAATLRLRELRSVSTPQAQPLDRDAPAPVRCSTADELLTAAWRAQRGDTANRVLDLVHLGSKLREVYTDEGIQIWLKSRNRNLQSRRPIDLLAAGEVDEVREEVRRILGGT